MFHFTSRRLSYTYISAYHELNSAFSILSLSACTGAITAACLGSGDILLTTCADAGSVCSLCTLITAFSFHFLAFLLGSSYYGFCILPLLSAAFGFLLYFASADAFSVGGSIFSELLSIAVPMLFFVPCFFVIAVEAFAASRRLHLLVSRRFVPLESGRPLHFILCVPFLVLAALAYCFFCDF